METRLHVCGVFTVERLPGRGHELFEPKPMVGFGMRPSCSSGHFIHLAGGVFALSIL